MPRKYPKKQTRLDVYMPDEAIEMLRFLSEEHGMSMSAYVRVLVRREWNASPHLHPQLKKGNADETE